MSWPGIGHDLVAIAAAAVLVSVASPAVASDVPVDTSVEIHTSVTRGMFHDGTPRPYEPLPDGAVLHGLLTEPEAATPVSEAVLTLERRLVGETEFSEVGAVTSDEFGMFYLTQTLVRTAAYRFAFAGDSSRAATTSEPITIRVERDLNARLVTGTPRHPRPILSGDINPGWAGRRVLWQRKRCEDTCGYRTIASIRAGADGGWRFRASFPPVGTRWIFRAVLPSAAGFAASHSARLLTWRRARGAGVARLRGMR